MKKPEPLTLCATLGRQLFFFKNYDSIKKISKNMDPFWS